MKKFFIVVSVLFAAAASMAYADNDRTISVTQLPESSRQFLQKHFTDRQIAYVTQDTDFLETTYEVVYFDNIKVEFRKNGDWKEVDCGHNPVPAAIVPEAIASFVARHYPNNFIRQIDKDSRDYELSLSGGLELTFDLNFNLIEIDD